MNNLPTRLARHMLEDHFRARMIDSIDTIDAVATYQKMCLVADKDSAWEATKVWFKPEKRICAEDSPEGKALTAVHALAKQDVLGLAIDAMVVIVNKSGGSDKEKLTAASILNELFGEKESTVAGLADKLVLNLVGK